MCKRHFSTIANALDEAWEYFAQRADADHDGNDFVPNEAMRLQMEIEQAQAALANLRASEDEPIVMGR